MKTLAAIKGATISRGNKVLLENFSLQLEESSITTIIGANGVGKTSLLLAIAGELALEGGSLSIAGKNISDYSLAELALLRTYCPSTLNSAFPFTVNEFVNFGSTPWRKNVSVMLHAERLARVLATFDLVHLGSNSVLSLSSGEQQRVLLAKTFLQGARLLILDEPTTALDMSHQILINKAVIAHKNEGGTVLIASHDQDFIKGMGGRIVELKG